MKNLVIIFIVLFSLSQVSAQSIVEAPQTMSKGSNNAFQVLLPNISAKDIGKEWKSFMKDYKGKPKYDKKTAEWFSDDAKIEAMSENDVDVYATFVEKTDNTIMTIWYNLGGAYLSTELHAEKVPLVDEMVNRFIYTSETMTGAMVEMAEKQLNKLQGSLTEIEKSEADYKKEIKAAKEAIAQAEKNIKEGQAKQVTLKVEIQTKEKEVNAIKEKVEMAGKKK